MFSSHQITMRKGKADLDKKKKLKSTRIKKRGVFKHDNLSCAGMEDCEPAHEDTSRSSCSFYMDERRDGLDDDDDSEPDRANPLWKVQSNSGIEQVSQKSPSIVKEEEYKPTIWEEIMLEYEDKRSTFISTQEFAKPFEPVIPLCSKVSAVQYLNNHIFPLLCPALEETIFKAKEVECLMVQKCIFNGLDYIAELLWNRNPRHPKRHCNYKNIFEIPHSIIRLYYNPRPIYPLSWVWTKEEAIIVLQRYIRRYLVCKQPDCAEMRQFWKTIKREKEKAEELATERSIALIEEIIDEVLNTLLSLAVFEAEWKKKGCRCVKTPCQCSCKCIKWCKCCDCFKVKHRNKSVACDCVKN